jgi:hypothetical protein
MRDTSVDADALVVEAIRRTRPAERVAHALAWSEQVREIALRRLRELHPGRTDFELVELMLGVRLGVPTGTRAPVER